MLTSQLSKEEFWPEWRKRTQQRMRDQIHPDLGENQGDFTAKKKLIQNLEFKQGFSAAWLTLCLRWMLWRPSISWMPPTARIWKSTISCSGKLCCLWALIEICPCISRKKVVLRVAQTIVQRPELLTCLNWLRMPQTADALMLARPVGLRAARERMLVAQEAW